MPWYNKPTLLSYINKKTDYVFIDESGSINNFKTIIKKARKGEPVALRDSTFVLTALYTSSRSLSYIYANFSSLKQKFFPKNKNFIFHSTDIVRRSFEYSKISDEKYALLTEQLATMIGKFKYSVVVTSINKITYAKKILFK